MIRFNKNSLGVFPRLFSKFNIYEILFPLFPIACIVFLFPGRSKSRFDPIDLSRSYGNEQLENIVDDIRLVPLETNDSCIVGQYDRVIVKGRSIFILDKMQNTVFCFDTTGKFRQKINRQGRSGQEYITADDFIVQDNTLIVFDNNKSQLQFYDFQGNYVKTIPVCQGDQIAVNPAGGYIVYSSVADQIPCPHIQRQGRKNRRIPTRRIKNNQPPERILQ